MKNIFSSLIVLFALNHTHSAIALNCKVKGDAKHSARILHHSCLKKWDSNISLTTANPADNCSQSLSNYIQSSKDLKNCFISAKNGTSN